MVVHGQLKRDRSGELGSAADADHFQTWDTLLRRTSRSTTIERPPIMPKCYSSFGLRTHMLPSNFTPSKAQTYERHRPFFALQGASACWAGSTLFGDEAMQFTSGEHS